MDDEGRTFFAPLEWSNVPDVNAGDRVEFEPSGPPPWALASQTVFGRVIDVCDQHRVFIVPVHEEDSTLVRDDVQPLSPQVHRAPCSATPLL